MSDSHNPNQLEAIRKAWNKEDPCFTHGIKGFCIKCFQSMVLSHTETHKITGYIKQLEDQVTALQSRGTEQLINARKYAYLRAADLNP